MFRPPSPIRYAAIAATSLGSASRRSALGRRCGRALFAESARHFGVDEARRDRVDCDAEPADFASQRSVKPTSEALVAA